MRPCKETWLGHYCRLLPPAINKKTLMLNWNFCEIAVGILKKHNIFGNIFNSKLIIRCANKFYWQHNVVICIVLAMHKKGTGSASIVLKAVCLVLALITGGSIFATGIMASADCGMKCCCRSLPIDMQHKVQRQLRSSVNCCSGITLNPCDLQSSQPYKLPEVIHASCRGPLHAASGPAVALCHYFSNGRYSSGIFTFQQLEQIFTQPPLYLQNRSYLIWCFPPRRRISAAITQFLVYSKTFQGCWSFCPFWSRKQQPAPISSNPI